LVCAGDAALQSIPSCGKQRALCGSREVAILKAAGYKTGRTTDVGWNDERSDPFRLKAFDIEDDSSVPWFAAQLTGLTLMPRYLRLGRVRRLGARLFNKPRALNRA